ncbi:extracellular solute-binding protein [Nocardioides sp.]|uniref:extracellular solute-binding protein n=1 Tax=Nocardioides sp. TaxID=35761 RepID=UPI0027374783|nr:extracellular solute-binding protein [Nocardioides sp.]MDP3890810.1 extracellular solute-binding protein [Nocardioides sp.]
MGTGSSSIWGSSGGTSARTRARLVALVALLPLALAACTDTADPEPEPTTAPAPTETTPAEQISLTFGVWGSPGEIEAYERAVDTYNRVHQTVEVDLVVWDDQETASRAVEDGQVPDVFLLDRQDLTALREGDLNQPVSDLLDERDIEFGDGYQRMGLQAFSGEGALQCMPHGTSPMVIYYNTDLIDFGRMEQRGLAVPEPGGRWNFSQFSEAAEFATRPRRNTRGVHIEPTLRALAPFVRAGGGSLFDNPMDPTTLTLSDEDGREGLETLLQLLRSPHLTPTPEQLERRTPLELFGKGRVAMIAGFRDMVPELREMPGLRFDVMPLPSISSRSTVGDLTGMCLARDTEHTSSAADFLAYIVSADAVGEVARAGRMVPANLEVAESVAFLQPGLQPAHAGVFNVAVRDIVLSPLLDTWDELDAAVSPLLHEMLTDPLLADLGALTEEIDETSRTVLSPEDGSEDPDEESDGGEPDDGETDQSGPGDE